MRFPVLFINFKTYAESTGTAAVALASLAKEVSSRKNCNIIIVAQPTDIQMISGLGLPVFAQHTDPVSYGGNTGSILPEAVKQAGAQGTVLNHAERKLTDDVLEKSISRCRAAGLLVMACAETTERAVRIASFSHKPDLIAVEPPELIGGDISVSTARPEIISDTVKAVHAIAKIPLITGAGIKNGKDVHKALELGCKGVFVASGIIKSLDRKKAIEDIVSGFK